MLTPRDHLLNALLAATPTPAPPASPIPVETADFPVWARIVIAMAFVLMLLVPALARFLPDRTPNPPAVPVTVPAPPTPASPTLSERVDDSSGFIERVLARLERQIDLMTAETERLKEKVDELQDERDEALRAKWEMQSQLAEMTRQMESARTQVVQLRAQLDARSGYQGGPW